MQISGIGQLMRMELRAPTMISVTRAWRWYLEGLGALLPAAIRQFGRRPKNILIEQGADSGADRRRIVARSWFGDARLIESNDVPALPASIALAAGKIYRTHLSLPSEAAQSLQKTIALRLDDLSPIPPEDAAFAIGETARSDDGRINVEIAIAKKNNLAEIATQYGDAQIAAIGAAPDQNGVLRFVFREENAKTRSNLQPLISAGIAIAAVFLFSLSIDVHLSRRLETLEQHEAAILVALRELRPALALFDGADATALAQSRGAPASSLKIAMQRALADLPASSLIENITLNNASIQISGFVPTDQAEGAADPADLQRSATNRPGFDRFTFESAPELAMESTP